jgi:thiol-disulfide isomerase/thioredoxin
MMTVHGSVLGLIVALAVGSPALAGAAKGDTIGPLRFADAEGRTITLDAPGVVYLVDFWALGCKPCIAEMPELERLANELEPSGGFQLVRVAWGGWNGSELLKVAEQAGMKPPVYSDPESWHDRLEVDAFPTKFLIRDGTVLARARGGGAGAYDRWRAAIERESKSAAAAGAP